MFDGVGTVEYVCVLSISRTLKAVQSQGRAVSALCCVFPCSLSRYTANCSDSGRHCHYRICKRPRGYLKNEVPTPTVTCLVFRPRRTATSFRDRYFAMPSYLQRKYVDLIRQASSKWVNWDPPIGVQVSFIADMSSIPNV